MTGAARKPFAKPPRSRPGHRGGAIHPRDPASTSSLSGPRVRSGTSRPVPRPALDATMPAGHHCRPHRRTLSRIPSRRRCSTNCNRLSSASRIRQSPADRKKEPTPTRRPGEQQCPGFFSRLASSAGRKTPEFAEDDSSVPSSVCCRTGVSSGNLSAHLSGFQPERINAYRRPRFGKCGTNQIGVIPEEKVLAGGSRNTADMAGFRMTRKTSSCSVHRCSPIAARASASTSPTGRVSLIFPVLDIVGQPQHPGHTLILMMFRIRGAFSTKNYVHSRRAIALHRASISNKTIIGWTRPDFRTPCQREDRPEADPGTKGQGQWSTASPTGNVSEVSWLMFVRHSVDEHLKAPDSRVRVRIATTSCSKCKLNPSSDQATIDRALLAKQYAGLPASAAERLAPRSNLIRAASGQRGDGPPSSRDAGTSPGGPRQ